MGIIKRILMFLWSLAGLLGVCALGLTTFGPWTKQVRAAMAASDPFFYATEILIAVLAVGLFILLLRSLFSRRATQVVVDTFGDGEITVTRDAIASQAAHIVSATAELHARDVYVNIRRRNRVDVRVRVEPQATIDIMSIGPVLHDRLVDELRLLCGDCLDKVSVEFLEAQDPSTLTASSEHTSPASEPDSDSISSGIEISLPATSRYSDSTSDSATDTKEAEDERA